MIFNADNFPELPHGWTSLTVDKSVESAGNSNKKLKTKDALDHGRFPVIDQGQSEISGYSDDESLVVDASELSPVILFGDHTRLLKQISQPFVPGADGTKLFRAKSFWDTRFVYQMLRAIKLPDKGYARHFQYLRDSVLPLPPLNEQKRIADKLDAVLARVDACRDRLDRIPAILKRFRQSVLAAATTGKLTGDWRAELDTAYGDSWRSLTLADICARITDGEHISPQKTEDGVPLLTAKNVTARGVDFSNTHFVTPADAQVFWKRCRPEPGDVLVCSRGTIGRCAEVPMTPPFCLMGTVILVKPNYEMVVPRYLLFALSAPAVQKSMQEASGATAVSALYLRDIAPLEMAVPGVEEQTEIVRRVEALFAMADRLEARHATARAQVEKLTPATLAKAFRGELVPQDPNDEPASELLERIRTTNNVNQGAGNRARSTRISPQVTATLPHRKHDKRLI